MDITKTAVSHCPRFFFVAFLSLTLPVAGEREQINIKKKRKLGLKLKASKNTFFVLFLGRGKGAP